MLTYSKDAPIFTTVKCTLDCSYSSLHAGHPNCLQRLSAGDNKEIMLFNAYNKSF